MITSFLFAVTLFFSVATVHADDDMFCTQEYDPVCGEDGRTYSNACRADQEGVGIDYYGECTDEDDDDDNDDNNDDNDDIGIPRGGDEGGGGDCFIATAAFDSPIANEVDTLREFRDEYLLQTQAGQEFVTFYYRHSPPIADYLREHAVVKYTVREALEYVVTGAELFPGIGEKDL